MKKTITCYRGRKAIAMIELIFAIVVMGIALLSVPNLLSHASKSGYTSLQQEAIATASSQINMILTKHWDENNTVEAVILQVSNGTASLNERNGTKTRTFISAGGQLNATSIGSDLNDFDDIDDYSGTSMTLRNFSDTEVTEGDIIDTNITIATVIDYIDDNTSGANDYDTHSSVQYNIGGIETATTNIKSVSILLTTDNPASELEKEITLRAFTCNIGSYEPEGRNIP